MNILMENITKYFAHNRVLDNAQFSLSSGEIHALMGENGAGKSTMMKILTGVYSKDSGRILIDNKEVYFKHPKEAENAGIYFVHQELNSVLDMTVEENIFLGKELHTFCGILNKKEMHKKSAELLHSLNVQHIDPQTLLHDLSVGQRQLIEIAKAFSGRAKVIILDEPTAALTEREANTLFSLITHLQTQGVSFIYISHRMEEIFKLCNRVTVMRDGKFIKSIPVAQTSHNDLVTLMIGRELGNLFGKEDIPKGETVLEIQNLSKKGLFKDITFSVSKGEILGVAGLMGAGRSEIMKTIFGYYVADSGKITVNGTELPLKRLNPKRALAHGLVYITEDRKEEGLMTEASISDNLNITNFARISDTVGFIRKKEEQKLFADSVSRFSIKCSPSSQACKNLSGGNQQKVVFAKWFHTNPAILILDEPTRGVDIGAKQEIYEIINFLVKNGAAVIMISSELPEIIGMSDRVMVIHEGSIAGFLSREQISQAAIMTLATGGTLDEKNV